MTKKTISIAAFIVMIAMFITGLVLIFSATPMGQRAVHAEMMRRGGSMDTGTFHIITETTITTYHTAGAVLALIGGAGFIVSGYVLHKELD